MNDECLRLSVEGSGSGAGAAQEAINHSAFIVHHLTFRGSYLES
jgi:hypothetical protein